MKILLTNDDGIFADGIKILAETLAQKHEIAVVAPACDCSCSGHSLTVFRKLTYEKYDHIKGAKGFAVRGTPADCVKFATKVLLGGLPDLIISGINNMPNLGTDVVYSGTVSAALEGAICGVRAVSLSVLYEDDGDYEYISKFMLKNLEKFYSLLNVGTVFNINFPSGKPSLLKGVRFARLGVQSYSDEYIEHVTGADEKHYTLVGDAVKTPDNGDDCDVELHDGMFVTVTPMHIQMTDFDALKKLTKTGSGIEL
ncbi:MAG: 5'/3'-nucleotidase SurE [Clostridiales bacterium]|jgi:5'-nucleotidase|nr:5'/3'-nucleotidase SurE [Clostridiales bacterium]